MDSAAPADTLRRPWWRHPATVVVLMALVVLVVLAIRWRLREIPLERDEGEYAYMGRLILEGGAPYGEAANMKWPGTWLAYAAIMAVFGQTTVGIHLGLLLVQIATTALLFVLGRRIAGTTGGAVAAGVHAVLAVGAPVLGLAAHATHFVVVCALGGFAVLTGRERPGWGRLLLAGVLFGLAGLMKQAGALFGLLAWCWLLLGEVRAAWKTGGWAVAAARIGLLGLGGVLPLAVVALWIWRLGTWPAFWWWTVVYAKAYASLVPFAIGMDGLGEQAKRILFAAPVLWGLAAAGMVALWFPSRLRAWRWWLLGLALVSFASVCPGLFFRQHYFLTLLPAVALLAGVAVAAAVGWLEARWPRWPLALVPLAVAIGGIGQALWNERAVFFEYGPAQSSRALYGANPFLESMEIGGYLREHTAPDARIAILGSEPQILFYAHRRSATPFLYVYPMTESQPHAPAMQREFAQRIESADPDYLVFVGIDFSWLWWPEADRGILGWFGEYQRGFHLVGLIDVYPDRPGEFRWFDQPSGERPRSRWFIAILRNNRLAPR